MKAIAKSMVLDLLLALVGISIVFLFVQFANLPPHMLVLAAAVVYFLLGLVRRDDTMTPLYIRALIISIFGIIYIPPIGQSYGTMNLPYPVAGYLGVGTGIWIRERISEWSFKLRALSLVVPVTCLALICGLFMPLYFEFWSTYIHGPAVDFSFFQ